MLRISRSILRLWTRWPSQAWFRPLPYLALPCQIQRMEQRPARRTSQKCVHHNYVSCILYFVENISARFCVCSSKLVRTLFERALLDLVWQPCSLTLFVTLFGADAGDPNKYTSVILLAYLLVHSLSGACLVQVCVQLT